MTPERLREIAHDCEDASVISSESNADALRRFADELERGVTHSAGPDVTCMDAAEMLVDEFINDARLWPDPEDRNELVRRVGTLLSMQRESLKGEFAEVLVSLKRCAALCEPHSAAREAKALIDRIAALDQVGK